MAGTDREDSGGDRLTLLALARRPGCLRSRAFFQPGTAIATFNVHGRYANNPSGNHACFFIKFVPGGFMVLEQHVKPDPDKIQTRFIRSRGKDSKLNPADNADAYSIIQ